MKIIIVFALMLGLSFSSPVYAAWERIQLPSSVYVNRGIEWLDKHEFDKAIECFNLAIAADPNDEKAYVGRGRAYNGQNKKQQAMADINKAIELNPKYAEAYAHRAYIYSIQSTFYLIGKDEIQYRKKLQQEIDDYSKAIEFDPKYYGSRGHAYFRLRNYEQAMMDANKMVEIYPQNYYGYMLRGFIYNKQGQYKAEILDYTKAIEIIKKDKDKTQFNDNNAWLHLYRGKAYIQLNEFENAINDYNVCITEHLERVYPQVYIFRGGAYAQMGDMEKANKDFAKFKELTLHKE